jgi:hypothetical protein
MCAKRESGASMAVGDMTEEGTSDKYTKPQEVLVACSLYHIIMSRSINTLAEHLRAAVIIVVAVVIIVVAVAVAVAVAVGFLARVCTKPGYVAAVPWPCSAIQIG